MNRVRDKFGVQQFKRLKNMSTVLFDKRLKFKLSVKFTQMSESENQFFVSNNLSLKSNLLCSRSEISDFEKCFLQIIAGGSVAQAVHVK